MGGTAELAAFVVSARDLTLPDEAIQAAHEMLVDSIGCALAGHSLELGRISVAYAERQAGDTTVIGGSGRVTPEAAIFANAQLMNALDLEEVLMNWGHQISVVLPVALAVGEQRGSSGAEIVRAVIVGYEIAARVSAALAGPVRVVGSPPDLTMESLPVFGFSSNIFGSVAAAALLMELGQEQIEHAFGIAAFVASVPCSTRFAGAPSIPMAKYGLMGSIAQSGFTAATLASMGFTGDRSILDGPEGFARFVGSSRFDTNDMLSGLGDTWWITKASFKRYPNCRMIHQAMDITEKIMREGAIAPASVRRIRARLWPRTVGSPVFTCNEPQSATDAQFSIPYALAATVYGRNTFPDFQSTESMRDPAVLALARQVEVLPEPRLITARYERYGSEPVGPIDVAPTHVEIETDQGIFNGFAETALGDSFDAAKRTTPGELIEKFRICAASVRKDEEIARLTTLLPTLNSAPDIRELMQLLAVDSRPAPHQP